jgi:glycosyltransferase involved in cell wall biosynthesis
MKLSVAIICKNEEAVIAKCLESVKDADEIIVCDTGSTDNTIGIASRYAYVDFGYVWKDDFADARNYALSLCSGDWVLSIDADETLVTSIENVKADIETAVEQGFDGMLVNMMWGPSRSHSMVRVFRADKRWVGKVHEHIACLAMDSLTSIQFGYSPAHGLDPDRNLRILQGIETKAPRDLFYLANEQFERGQLEAALVTYREYVKVSAWREEKSDANLRIARCLWQLNRGDEARDACLQSILGNPEFKEALLFMAELSFEKQAVTWRRFADTATNNGVIFIRGNK